MSSKYFKSFCEEDSDGTGHHWALMYHQCGGGEGSGLVCEVLSALAAILREIHSQIQTLTFASLIFIFKFYSTITWLVKDETPPRKSYKEHHYIVQFFYSRGKRETLILSSTTQ